MGFFSRPKFRYINVEKIEESLKEIHMLVGKISIMCMAPKGVTMDDLAVGGYSDHKISPEIVSETTKILNAIVNIKKLVH